MDVKGFSVNSFLAPYLEYNLSSSPLILDFYKIVLNLLKFK